MLMRGHSEDVGNGHIGPRGAMDRSWTLSRTRSYWKILKQERLARCIYIFKNHPEKRNPGIPPDSRALGLPHSLHQAGSSLCMTNSSQPAAP